MAELKVVTSFEYLGEHYPIKKFSSFRRAKDFKRHALPLVASMFKPVEKMIASLSHEFVIDWGILDSIVGSEDEIDGRLIPAFAEILKAVDGDKWKNVPIDENMIALRPEEIFCIVYSQIKLEGIIENFVTQRLGFLQDLSLILELDTTDLAKSISRISSQLGMSSAQSKVRAIADRLRLNENLEKTGASNGIPKES